MITRTERYAAKQAYQLFLMTGKTDSRTAGLTCWVVPQANSVLVWLDGVTWKSVPIAQSWANL